jgi:hypothetical protein
VVESALKLDIDELIRRKAIQPGKHLGGEIKFHPGGDDEFAIEFESSVLHPLHSWLRLKYAFSDYWTGEQHEIDDKIYLATSRPFGGGVVVRNQNRQVRVIYLPLGGCRFRSRHAYRLAYASQREEAPERATRRARKLCRRLGGDWMDDDRYPEKPPRMRWATYNQLLDKLAAADGAYNRAADERLFASVAKRGWWP